MSDVLTEAQQAVRAAVDTHACFTCSFQAEDVALLHLLIRERPDLPVLFLETGYHFSATTAFRDRLRSAWNLNLINLQSTLSRAGQEAQHGRLYESDPTRCCQIRKVEPLMSGLEPYDVWFTGLRREQSPTRANLQIEEQHRLPTGKLLRKISPLARWTWRDVMAYTTANEIPLLSLYQEGYTSIGCEPCTRKPADADNPRSGRWGGHKLECGIHTFTDKGAA